MLGSVCIGCRACFRVIDPLGMKHIRVVERFMKCVITEASVWAGCRLRRPRPSTIKWVRHHLIQEAYEATPFGMTVLNDLGNIALCRGAQGVPVVKPPPSRHSEDSQSHIDAALDIKKQSAGHNDVTYCVTISHHAIYSLQHGRRLSRRRETARGVTPYHSNCSASGQPRPLQGSRNTSNKFATSFELEQPELLCIESRRIDLARLSEKRLGG
jgi:hypothetical protein